MDAVRYPPGANGLVSSSSQAPMGLPDLLVDELEQLKRHNAYLAKRISDFEGLLFEARLVEKHNQLISSGCTAFESENFSEAIACFEASNNLGINFDAFLGLGETYFKMRMWDQANIEFRACLEMPESSGLIEFIKQRIHAIEKGIDKNET